jgi:probable phosphoglycerate mutase
LILLARHGETDDNARGVVQGWIDTPLNDTGRVQARALAEEVAARGGIERIVSSHLSRARETAEIVGAVVGIEVEIDERLAESRRGSWEGRALAEIQESEPETWAAWRRGGAGFRFPGGGESLAEHQARVLAALDDIRADGRSVLAVMHGGSVRCAVAATHPDGLDAFFAIPVPNAALIELEPSLS